MLIFCIAMPTSPTTSTPTAARAVRILYAEDVRELRELARVVFTREGHQIECANDGIAALDRLVSEPGRFDLLITDHHMPRMNGLDLVKNVRGLAFSGKIMVFSSELNPGIAAEYQRLQVDRILFKPVYPSFLRQAIAELFPAVEAAEALAELRVSDR